jgi:hypothetical protein
MPIFGKLICDDDDCGGPLDVEGTCLDCGRVVDPLSDVSDSVENAPLSPPVGPCDAGKACGP